MSLLNFYSGFVVIQIALRLNVSVFDMYCSIKTNFVCLFYLMTMAGSLYKDVSDRYNQKIKDHCDGIDFLNLDFKKCS